MRVIPIVLLALLLGTPARAASVQERDRYFVASDGTRLHYIEAGMSYSHTIVLVPGWTMPAWIFEPQIQALGRSYHVVAFDPRGQGGSDVPTAGYEPMRRGKDIGELIAQLGRDRVVVVAWSLGVLDTLAYVHTTGDARLAGLVLVDNSVGEDPPPAVIPHPPGPARPPPPHDERMRRFVAGMFRTQRGQAYLDRLTRATLRTPEYAAKALLAYPLPRTYWREAVYATGRPLLYIVRPRWIPQAETLVRNRPGTESEIFTEAGHALFVDEAQRFNTIVDRFVHRRIWP